MRIEDDVSDHVLAELHRPLAGKVTLEKLFLALPDVVSLGVRKGQYKLFLYLREQTSDSFWKEYTRFLSSVAGRLEFQICLATTEPMPAPRTYPAPYGFEKYPKPR